MVFFKVGRTGQQFSVGTKKIWISLDMRLPLPESTSTEKFVGGSLTSSHFLGKKVGPLGKLPGELSAACTFIETFSQALISVSRIYNQYV